MALLTPWPGEVMVCMNARRCAASYAGWRIPRPSLGSSGPCTTRFGSKITNTDIHRRNNHANEVAASTILGVDRIETSGCRSDGIVEKVGIPYSYRPVLSEQMR